MIGDRVELARVARGMSQRDLASAIGLSAMAISKIETGQSTPSFQTLRAICEATALSPVFFSRQPKQLPSPLYRKRSRLGVKATRTIQALGTIQAEGILCAREAAGIRLPVRVRDLSGAAPEEAAQATRRLLGLPDDQPIPHLIATLEQAGCVVHQLTGCDDRFDGFSTLYGDRPVIILGSQREGGGDRQRMTAAHELAHTVLHRRGGTEHKRAEQEADAFAGALLLPRRAIKDDLSTASLTPVGLAPLKAKWRVSLAALAMRAYQVGLLDSDGKTRFFKELGVRGWRRLEPVPIPLEEPQVTRKSLQVIRKRLGHDRVGDECGGLSTNELAEIEKSTRAATEDISSP